MARRFGRHGARLWTGFQEYVQRHKVQCLIALIVIIGAVSIGFAAAQAASRQSYAESFVVTDDTIRVGIRTGVDGFGMLDENGEITGFDREYIDEVLSRLIDTPKIYEYIPLTSQDAGAAVKYGEAQLALGQLSQGRTQTSGFYLTDAYASDNIVAVVADSSRLENLGDLESGIGVLATSISVSEAAEELAKQGIDQTLTSYSDYESALTDLSHSRINAVLMPYSIAKRLQQAGYRILAQPIFDVQYRIMLSSTQSAVGQQINRIIAQLEEDGTAAALRAKWGV